MSLVSVARFLFITAWNWHWVWLVW